MGILGAIWKSVLAGVVGTYSVIKQHKLNKRMIAMGEEEQARAAEFFAMTKDSFENITKPVFNCYKGAFNAFRVRYDEVERHYIDLAFDIDDYVPDFITQEGRVIGAVQNQFDRALKERKRQMGKFNAGRVENENLRFALATATAKTDALNVAYRFEEDRRDRLSSEYWQRRTQAAAAVQNIGSRVFAGLNSGAGAVSAGIASTATGFNATAIADSNTSAAIANQSDAFGSIGGGAFGFAGANLPKTGVGAAVASPNFGQGGSPVAVTGSTVEVGRILFG